VAGPSLPSPYAERVLDVVARIPPGRALAYGDVAELLGGRGARAVGGVLARHGSGVPWWRVVRADGSLPVGHEQEAAQRLRAEGVPLREGRVDLARCRWDGSGAVGPGC
jgi:alkylated DNA nucleotide flippase Atl1